MSVIGTPCLFCHEPIIVRPEASSCLRCGSVFHRRCAEESENQCPKCNDRVDHAERAYHYSKVCPDCLAPNSPQRERCAKCGAWTRWENEGAYRNFLAAHRQRCRGVIQSSLIKLALVLLGGGFLGIAVMGFSLLGIAVLVIALLKAWTLVMTMLRAGKKLEFS